MEWWQESSIPEQPEFSIVATPAMVSYPFLTLQLTFSIGQPVTPSTQTQHYGIVILSFIDQHHHLNHIRSFSTPETLVM